MYIRLLKQINPKISIVVAASYNTVFVEACKELDIPVVELQHGGSHHRNPKYVFPEDVSLDVQPDYHFLFGKFWKDTVDYHLDDEDVYTVGFPYLEEEYEKYSNLDKKKQVIFISQPPVGSKLSKLASKIGERNPEYNIVYKLHPKENNIWKREYPWLIEAPVTVIDDDSTPLYKHLAESAIQVGCNSTVIYEGLIFDLETYLLDSDGTASMRMKELIDNSSVSTISSIDELSQKVSQHTMNAKGTIDTDYFFNPNAVQNIEAALEDVIKQENNIN